MTELSNERRRFPRVEHGAPIQYKKLKSPGEPPAGAVSRDLGQGGVRFLINEFLSLASRLVIEINLPSSNRPLKAISKVAWIRKVPYGDQYEVGNQFLDMTKEDKKLINDYVDSLIPPTIF
jgi:c-di-GMP-binding flagellar brake protein YcgR